MMFASIGFTAPFVLFSLLVLPLIWWLLRFTPPQPVKEIFPPTQILKTLQEKEETPASSPWWLTLLRLLLAAFFIFALTGPIWKPAKQVLANKGRLLLVVDNGWGAAKGWAQKIATAKVILNEARQFDRPVSLVFSVSQKPANLSADTADEAEKRLIAAKAHPLVADYERLAKTIAQDANSARSARQASTRSSTNSAVTSPLTSPVTSPVTSIVYLSSSLQQQGDNALISALEQYGASESIIYQNTVEDFRIITKVENNSDRLLLSIERAQNQEFQQGVLIALDKKGRKLGEAPFEFDEGDFGIKSAMQLPVELRNEVAQIKISKDKSAGATYLLDDSFERRRIGLISGEANDQSQPLLSPLYYIKRALAPTSDLINTENANLAISIPNIIAKKPSVMVLADVGTLSQKLTDDLKTWVEEGGTLLRFSGPHLAAAAHDDPLLPVKLRKGERNLSGSLTWGKPKILAKFHDNSPFQDLALPQDVTIKRQVLAEPNSILENQTWVSLEDGTPLVTEKKLGKGQIILFHVSADASWSNLPLSGSFVLMLRKIIASAKGLQGGTVLSKKDALKPYQILNGVGDLITPPSNVKPLTATKATKNEQENLAVTNFDNPPGLYGDSEAFFARNLFLEGAKLRPLEAKIISFFNQQLSYIIEKPISLKPWFLLAAALLFIVDCLVMIWMRGGFNFKTRALKRGFIGSFILVALIFANGSLLKMGIKNAHAQEEEEGTPIDFLGALQTRFAYVKTGNLRLDDISHQGLIGLTDAIAARTALEPADPIGVDLAKDELSFYPLIYWPIEAGANLPSLDAMAKLDAYMKKGGTVLFDTRDALTNNGSIGGSPEALQLQRILASLDIPPLEVVPLDHVLTRTFFLLERFVGLYADGDLWVEALPKDNEETERLTQVGDGVSSIIITSNDLASAWAVDENGRYMFPTVPQNLEQRNYAYRTGINIVMYTLTGNYKADQVHIPALLERLGQ